MEDVKKTVRNRITRMKIGETLVKLLDHTSLANIKIATISKLTGVSRMTFYHYYDSKEEALKDYLSEIIELYKTELVKRKLDEKFKTVDHLEFTFRFFAKYDKLILKLEKIGCYKYIVDCVNEFMEREYLEDFKQSYYDLYFYGGGIINVYMNWIHNDKSEHPRNLARKYCRFLVRSMS